MLAIVVILNVHVHLRAHFLHYIVNVNQIKIIHSIPFYIGVKDDERIQTGFCIKGVTKVSNFDLDWPRGDYCILKYGDCPSG